MSWQVRIPRTLLADIRDDLARPHRHAYERVGFLGGRSGRTSRTTVVVLNEYRAVADEHYLVDETAGATIGPAAIRGALQWALTDSISVFHVHAHGHLGQPQFSTTDRRSTFPLVDDLFNVQPSRPHGCVLLSHDSIMAVFSGSKGSPLETADEVVVVGYPLEVIRARNELA